jgi:histone H2B
MVVMNDFIGDCFFRLAADAANLARHSKRATLSAREVQTATRLVLPGELAKHAVGEGNKAVLRFGSIREK